MPKLGCCGLCSLWEESQHFVPSPPGLKPPEKIFFLVLMVENSRLKPAAHWIFGGKFPVYPTTESEMNSSGCPEILPQPRRSRGNFHKGRKASRNIPGSGAGCGIQGGRDRLPPSRSWHMFPAACCCLRTDVGSLWDDEVLDLFLLQGLFLPNKSAGLYV